jgi:hypothetical protein
VTAFFFPSLEVAGTPVVGQVFELTISVYNKRLFTTDILHKSGYPPFKDMLLFVLAKGVDFQIRFTHVSVPYNGMEKPHKHDFDKVTLFVPCSDDLKAYDAESELYLGDEGERHVINKTTALYVPAG